MEPLSAKHEDLARLAAERLMPDEALVEIQQESVGYLEAARYPVLVSVWDNESDAIFDIPQPAQPDTD